MIERERERESCVKIGTGVTSLFLCRRWGGKERQVFVFFCRKCDDLMWGLGKTRTMASLTDRDRLRLGGGGGYSFQKGRNGGGRGVLERKIG